MTNLSPQSQQINRRWK